MKIPFVAMLLVGCCLHAGQEPPLPSGPPSPAEKPAPPLSAVFVGEILPLAEVLREQGVPCDAERLRDAIVLYQRRDKVILPILPDDASRAIFVDERLRHRRAEIQARRLSGLPHLQVLVLRVEHEGRMRIPEYFCEICSIAVRAPQECPCCQGAMELRMKPEDGR